MKIKELLLTLLKHKTQNTYIQFIRYGAVGTVGFIIDFAVLFALTEWINFHYLVSSALSFSVALSATYFLSVAWVFHESKLHNKMHEFWIFLLIGIIGLIINQIFMWTFTEHIGFHYLLSKTVSAILLYGWNFFARKKILFK
jgi:putative flippase GtrA